MLFPLESVPHPTAHRGGHRKEMERGGNSFFRFVSDTVLGMLSTSSLALDLKNNHFVLMTFKSFSKGVWLAQKCVRLLISGS